MQIPQRSLQRWDAARREMGPDVFLHRVMFDSKICPSIFFKQKDAAQNSHGAGA